VQGQSCCTKALSHRLVLTPQWMRSILQSFKSLALSLRRVVQADLNLQPRSSACWTTQLLSAFQGLRGCELYVRAVQTGHAITMQEFTADLKHRMRGVWRNAELVDPNTHNNKLATYHSWFAIPFTRNERMPINVPRYLHLDLSKHVMRNISRFRLRAHTLKVEAAAWHEDSSCVCDQCPGEDEHVQNEVHALLFCQDHQVCELRKDFSFLNTSFLRTFQQPNPFCCKMSTTNLFMISFLSRTIEFFFFFLSLWIYLWLAETSQQPISQTTWLKVTPHSNHCNH